MGTVTAQTPWVHLINSLKLETLGILKPTWPQVLGKDGEPLDLFEVCVRVLTINQ